MVVVNRFLRKWERQTYLPLPTVDLQCRAKGRIQEILV